MSDFIINIIVNILCSVAASLIFLMLVLHFLRPLVAISPVIVKGKDTSDAEKVAYSIKIVNKSLFKAFDINVELHEVRQIPAHPSGFHTQLKKIPLIVEHFPCLAPNRLFGRKDGVNCVQFRTNADIEKIVSNEQRTLKFQIILRHGLTGLSEIFQKEYVLKELIKNGQFSNGNKFEII